MIHSNLVAIDVETTMNGNDNIGLAHPMCPDNRIVAWGHCSTSKIEVFHEADWVFGEIPPPVWDASYTTYVGQNICFDLLYFYKLNPITKEGISNIWDTQVAEYLLTAQTHKFASLDELCIKYGEPCKDTKVTEYFRSGLGADKVPKELLLEYLKHDLEVTLSIAKKQIEKASRLHMMPLCISQMNATLAITEMMFNGLYVDKDVLDKYTVEIVNRYVETKLDLAEKVVGEIEDLNSPKQWSEYFFGGTKKVKEKEEAGTFKNGKPKYKTITKEIEVPAKLSWTPPPEKVGTLGRISVDDSVLAGIIENSASLKLTNVALNLERYRWVSKQLSTYVQGLSNHLIGDKIHGNLNQTATVTGRLSSSNPNLQNISNNPIKKIFTSRFPEGKLVEVDFKQLEIYGLAFLSQSKQLIYDLKTHVDIHGALYRSMYDRPPSASERKAFKSRTFQLIYGAGPKAIAEQAKISLDEAKKFIETFYKRYPTVKKWHTDMYTFVDSNSSYIKNEASIESLFREFIYTSMTGRKYKFREYEDKRAFSSRTYRFSPTEIKNYPIQGLCTGDIVPMMLGQILLFLKRKPEFNSVKMINTIHDSILFDVPADVLPIFCEQIKEFLQNTHTIFEDTFKIKLPLELQVNVSMGDNWFNME